MLGGCASPTAVDVSLLGADRLGATQVNLVASVGGEPLHMATLPDPERPLGRREDVLIVLGDRYAGQVLLLHATPVVAGTARTADSVEGAGELVAGRTKQIVLCFDPAGCDGD